MAKQSDNDRDDESAPQQAGRTHKGEEDYWLSSENVRNQVSYTSVTVEWDNPVETQNELVRV